MGGIRFKKSGGVEVSAGSTNSWGRHDYPISVRPASRQDIGGRWEMNSFFFRGVCKRQDGLS
jgi:hypothetical protein